MSLKFGIYLVEQRIISPEQFCGLVKVQQETTKSLASIALRKNVLTINQVARILDWQDATPDKSFIQVAIANDLLDMADGNELLREQEVSCPTIRKLIVECGLLSARQSAVLFHHFEKLPPSPLVNQHPETAPAIKPPVKHPQVIQNGPPRPKFQQKPVIVNPYSDAIS